MDARKLTVIIWQSVSEKLIRSLEIMIHNIPFGSIYYSIFWLTRLRDDRENFRTAFDVLACIQLINYKHFNNHHSNFDVEFKSGQKTQIMENIPNEKDFILKNAHDITLDSDAVTKARDANNFCSIWPMAKQGLELLKSIIKNPVVKVAIGVIIDAGDAVSSRVCQ